MREILQSFYEYFAFIFEERPDNYDKLVDSLAKVARKVLPRRGKINLL